MTGDPSRSGRAAAAFLRAYIALALLGLASLAASVPLLAPAVEVLRARPELAGTSTALLYAIVLAQPALLLLVLVAAGLAAARRAGLRSLVADAARGEPVRLTGLRDTAQLAAMTAVAALLVVAADAGFARAFPQAFAAVPPATAVPVAARIGALFYGGVVEELMLRLGVMSLLVALGRALFPAVFTNRPGRIVWPAIVVAAVLFGALHLPAMAGLAPLTSPVVARTVLLNAALGILFGYAYWRYALEYAMASHALVHVVFGLVGALAPQAARL